MIRFNFEQKLSNMIRYAYLISRETDDQQNQVAQIGFLGRKVQCRLIVPYGFTNGAPRGSELVVYSIGAQANNLAAMATYPQNRRKSLKEWEVSVGNQNKDSEVFYDEDGNISILAPNGDIDIRTNNIEIVNDNIDIQCEDITVNSSDINITAADVTINCDNLNINASGTITLIAGGQTLSISSGGINNNGTNIGSDHTHPAGNILDSGSGQCTGNSGTPQ